MNRKKRFGSAGQHIFISYSRRDIWEMRTIHNAVRMAGLRVWIDERLIPGTSNWADEMGRMVAASSGVLCICSPDARRSKWVRTEIDLALKNGRLVYPVLVRGDPKEAIPTSLLPIHFTDCRTDYQGAIANLTTELIDQHRKALIFDMRSLFDPLGVKWSLTGSLFWFASEVRKIRLFLRAERPTSDRVISSVRQLLHHARRLNIDHFSIRDIRDVLASLETIDFELMTHADRAALENKIRLVQDKVAALAEAVDPSFAPGSYPGNRISSHLKARKGSL